MRLALLPGLLAVVLGIFAQGHTGVLAAGITGSGGGTHSLYSVLAQATTTSTVAITGTATTDATAAITGIATITDTATITAGTTTTATEGTVTATAEITSTGSLTPTATPARVPLSGEGGGTGNLQLNPFDWNFLTSPASSGLPGPLACLYLLLMLALLGVSAYVYFVRRPQWKRTNTVYYRAANRFAPVFLWIAGLGILFVLLRIPPVDFFNLRFWLYLWLLAALIAAGWVFYWYRTSYPKEMARYQKTQRQKQYMPGSSKAVRATAGPSTPVSGSGKSTTAKRRKKK
ncbi:MAG: hypothetical protein M3328_04285 [Chloroflexota bacterium]|nr:hypothetical protein [Chloroflexota bacterium]